MLAEERLFYLIHSIVSVGSVQSSAILCQNFGVLYRSMQDRPRANCHVPRVGHSGGSGPACHQSGFFPASLFRASEMPFSWDDLIEPAWRRRPSWRAPLPFCFI